VVKDIGSGRPVAQAPALSVPDLRISHDRPSLLALLGPAVGRGVDWKDPHGRVAVRTAIHAGGASVEVAGVADFAIDGSDVIVARPVAGRARADVEDAFRRTVTPLALTYRGAQYLHASSVLSAGGVVALCGRSGTGKSTVAAALDRRGYEVWGDDAVVFACPAGSGRPVSARLPSVLRLDDEAATLVAALPSAASHRRRPSADSQPLDAVVILERGTAPVPEVTELSSGQAVSAMLSHALCLSLDDPAARRQLASGYVAVAATVRVLRVVFAPIAERFATLIEVLATHLGPPLPD
jgi:hypothetical protein